MSPNLLKNTFFELANNYSNDQELIATLWTEISKKHSQSKRFYHDLSHLENLLFQLQQVKEEATNWNTILFALYYHDIVYDIIKSNNEEKSAELAEKKLKLLGVPDQEIAQVKSIILATRSHSISEDKDINIFTDADLSILGQSWDMYEKYYQNVRQEYKVYPISLYKMGRIRVLQHFLSMERIYKTSYFYQNCEQLAKINLQREIDELNKE